MDSQISNYEENEIQNLEITNNSQNIEDFSQKEGKNNVNEKKRENVKKRKTLPPNTVYNALKAKNIEFSRKDLRKIANAVLIKYHKKFGENESEKIEQIEDGKEYSVFCYPESMRREIKNIVSWFFNEKKTRMIKHDKQLKLERLEKLKREDSPDYFLELARFNIAAEEERKRKKEEGKNIKAKPKNDRNFNKNQRNTKSKYNSR